MKLLLTVTDVQVKNWIWKMRAEGKAFCSDKWYLLAGVLLQKRSTSLPAKRKASLQFESHTNGANSNGVSLGNGTSNGHTSNGHTSSGHSVKLDGYEQEGLGDCSGLRHRYSTDADGAANTAECQLDELIQVMTALR